MAEHSFFGAFSPRSLRLLLLAGGILVLFLAVCYAIDFSTSRSLVKNWNAVLAVEREQRAADVHSRFALYQQRTVAATESVAHAEPLRSALRSDTDSARVDLFSQLATRDRMNLSYEVYDRHRHLLAWSGMHSSVLDSAYFSGAVVTAILPGPILSYFIVVIPLNVEGERYFVVGKRLFDVNYPISNRFISNQAFATTFTSRFPFDMDFSFSVAHANTLEERQSIPLLSVSGDTLGYAIIPVPLLAEDLDEAHGRLATMMSVAMFLIIVLITYFFAHAGPARRSSWFRVTVWTIGIWLFRYLLLARDFPQSAVSTTVFDPSYFASPFGFGLAKSVGDMSISAILFLLNIVLIVRPWIERLLPGRDQALYGGRHGSSLAAVAVGVSLLLFVSFRGFQATISSAVLDSSLPYDDPTFVLPSLELGTMLASLACIAVSLVLFGVAAVLTCRFCISRLLFKGRSSGSVWITTIAMMAGLGLLFGLYSPSPLLGQLQRVFSVALMGVLAYVFQRSPIGTDRPVLFRPALLLLVAAAVGLLIAALDRKVHELDRTRTEVVASEALRPSDTWLKVIIQRALDQLSNIDAVNVLAADDEQATNKLAFTQWAKSILSREGNDCAIVMFDHAGNPVSTFQIGISPFKATEPFQDISPMHRYLDVEERPGSNEKHYVGYAPIFSSDSTFLGGVWVELSAVRSSSLSSRTTNLLSNYSSGPSELRFRKLSVSEYLKGRLLWTTDETLPRDYRLPDAVGVLNRPMLWVDETIEGVSYETLYARDQTKPSQSVWLAFRMNSLDLRWHLFSFLRYVLFYALSFLVVGGIYLLWRGMRANLIPAHFRGKLMTAFMVVSVIPVIVLAYYNREYVLERFQESTEKRLSQQTSVVLASVQSEFGVNAPFSLVRISNAECVSLAGRMDADFILYNDKYLQATSKPEIFTAELLDERLSAEAYVNIMLLKKGFYSQNRSIGTFPYIVGYRPITTETGAVIGAVSVPTLFRQSEIDEELTQRNVLLFGAYAVALLLSIGVGTLFANQISSPVLRLKNATRRLAGGDWNVSVRTGRRDELGELEQSFEEMAKDLHQAQEQMLAVQREAAWKEMAKQVAHEIKNPLTPIKLSIQHLRRAYADNVKNFDVVLQQVSATILQQIETLTRIASEFSHFARMPERTLSYCDVHEILTEAKNLFSQHAGVTFVTDFRARGSVVFADREELRRAFINVIRNAIQAMKERGTIRLETDADVDILEVGITDTGPGIPPEIKDRLFEPNFSTKTDGMGLGLSIVKKTIDDLGGTITIDSEPGTGTTVRMKLLLSMDHDKA